MKALLAMLILVSPFANADCDLIEDPPISEVNCNLDALWLPSGSEWTRLYYNPDSSGLKSAGTMSATVGVVMSGDHALIAKIEANSPMLDRDSVSAGTDASTWIDIVLHRSSLGANSIELIAYRYVAGRLVVAGSASTAILGRSAATKFSIDYSYTTSAGVASVTANVRAGTGKPVAASLKVADFGQTMPSMRLRRGIQPKASGVLSASFTQSIAEGSSAGHK